MKLCVAASTSTPACRSFNDVSSISRVKCVGQMGKNLILTCYKLKLLFVHMHSILGLYGEALQQHIPLVVMRCGEVWWCFDWRGGGAFAWVYRGLSWCGLVGWSWLILDLNLASERVADGSYIRELLVLLRRGCGCFFGGCEWFLLEVAYVIRVHARCR